MKHLTNEMIADYVLKTGPKDELDRLKAHLDSCETCSQKAREIARMYRTSDNSGITPSPELQGRILSTYHASELKPAATRVDTKKRGYAPALLAAAASVIIIAGISVLLYYPGFFKETQIQHQSVSVDRVITGGTAVINGATTGKAGFLREGDTAELNDNTVMTVSHGEAFRLKAADHAFMTLASSYIENGTAAYTFSAARGVFLSDIDHSREKFTYIISTPQGEIMSLGTKFLVEVADDKTAVTLGEGSISMHCSGNGQHLNGESGKRYILAATITVENARNSVISAINNFEIPGNESKKIRSQKTETTITEKDETSKDKNISDAGASSDKKARERYGAEKDSMRSETRHIRSEMRNESRFRNQENREIRETRKGRHDR